MAYAAHTRRIASDPGSRPATARVCQLCCAGEQLHLVRDGQGSTSSGLLRLEDKRTMCCIGRSRVPPTCPRSAICHSGSPSTGCSRSARRQSINAGDAVGAVTRRRSNRLTCRSPTHSTRTRSLTASSYSSCHDGRPAAVHLRDPRIHGGDGTRLRQPPEVEKGRQAQG